MLATLLALCLALALALAACNVPGTPQDGQSQAAPQSTLDEIVQRGVMRVGFSTFVPWAMKDKEGEFIGFEIDVARRMAEDMGVEVEFVPTQWDGIIPALLTGKFDIIIGGMGIRPQRNLKVNFSDPYEYSGMSIVANRELAQGFHTLADFNNPDVVIAARLGTTAVEAVQNFLPRAQLKLFDQEAQTIQELLNGRATAVVASDPLPRNTAAEYPDQLYLPLDRDFTREPIGFAVRKGDVDFLNFLNNWIKVANSVGWLQARYDYWFTTDEWRSMVE